jgi:hypothetical protein
MMPVMDGTMFRARLHTGKRTVVRARAQHFSRGTELDGVAQSAARPLASARALRTPGGLASVALHAWGYCG